MNPKLQQAIAAVRSGQKKEAQFLLTQVLKEDPGESQAWFLLSQIVDSEQKQLAYLQKTVALKPDHELAVQQLAKLEAAEPVPAPSFPEEPEVADADQATEAVAEDEEALAVEWEEPVTAAVTEDEEEAALDWEELESEEAVEVEAFAVPEVPEPFDTLTEMLEPVKDESVEAMPVSQLAAEASEPELARVLKPTPEPAAGARDQQAALTRMLYGLSAAAVIVLMLLLYVLITAF